MDWVKGCHENMRKWDSKRDGKPIRLPRKASLPVPRNPVSQQKIKVVGGWQSKKTTLA